MKSIFIATPTTGRMVTLAYAKTLVEAIIAIRYLNYKFSYQVCDGAHVPDARNQLIAQFLQSAATHLLFLDSDMAIDKDVFAQLITADKDMIGLVYPKREFDLENYGNKRVSGYTHTEAMADSLDFRVGFVPGTTVMLNGVVPVRRLPFGCVLIARSVCARMKSGWCDEFVMDGDRLSEDYAFCERCNNIGVDIFALTTANVGHVSLFSFGVPFYEKLKLVDKK